MSEVENSLVYRGLWINWDQGPIMGRTITTDSSIANVVIALLTVLTTQSLAQLWNLLTFFYHQARAAGGPSDGLYWQQQALLRTLPTPTSLISDSFKLWWAWRGRTKRPFTRSMLPVFLALLFAVAAVVSGIFSAYAVDTSNIEVLVNSPYCGMINISRTYAPQTGASTHYSRLLPVVKAYTSDCYQNTQNLPSICQNNFVRPNVSISRHAADCPWDGSMCAADEELPAVDMDSGLLDESHFGFNVEAHNKVRYRKKTVCNVLPLDPYVTVEDATVFADNTPRPLFPNEKFIALHYFYSHSPNSTLEKDSVTFQSSELMVNITDSYGTDSSIIYTSSRDPTLNTTNAPLTAMNRSDADVAINVIWLNDVQYSTPNSDPLFSAHTHRSWGTNTSGHFDLFVSDKPAGLLGCANQYQFCTARKGQPDFCTALVGLPSVITNETFPGASATQLLMLQLIRDASLEMDVSTGPLFGYTQAGAALQSGELPALPDDQWKTEAVGWETLAWAGIQVRLSDYAVGPKVRDPNADQYVIWPSTPAERELCGAMKMRKSGGFANINVFALSFISTFTVLITILNTFVLRFFIYLSHFRRALAPRLDRWIQDGVFQLQRRAFEASNRGTWVGAEKEVPVTAWEERLGELSVEGHAVKVLVRAATFGSVKTWGTK